MENKPNRSKNSRLNKCECAHDTHDADLCVEGYVKKQLLSYGK